MDVTQGAQKVDYVYSLASQKHGTQQPFQWKSSNPCKYIRKYEHFHDFHGLELIHGVKNIPHRQNDAEEVGITDSSVVNLLYI